MAFTHKDIIKAVKDGDLALVQQILESDPSLLESADPDGARPLHFACWKGHTEIVAYLLNQGADITAQNPGNTHWGGTPLHVTAHANNRPAALLLLQRGADVHSISANGRTPLQETELHKATAVAKLLREHGAA
ncbi:MAG: ankyrin repeat protein [Chthonomonadales bacterium]|nr:ankyrin repeat protein [Chthonomonadales bacterium]